MRIAGAISCLLLLIPIVGSPGRRSVYWDTSALKPYRDHAYEFVKKGQLLEAAKAYETAYREALRLGDKQSAATFMNNVGACRLGIFQIREAMSALIVTRKMAEEIGYGQMVRLSTLNLSQLYLQMGDLEAAGEAADRGLEALPVSDLPIYRIQVLLQLGKIRSRQKDMAASKKFFFEAIALAERSNELSALGRAWNHLGYEYLNSNQLNQAEDALLRAHEILAGKNDPETYVCYPNLGRLYLLKKDLGEASNWMDLAVKASSNGNAQLPGWYAYHERGKLRQAQQKHALALEDFRLALHAARIWRLEVVPPANDLRISSEIKLQDIYDSFLSSGYKVYLSLPSEKLMTELFLASEENRAWSLRQALREDSNSRLPDEYFELLSEMRSADSRTLNADGPKGNTAKFAHVRNRLLEMEAAAGLELPSGGDERMALQSIQLHLQPDEALLSFHLSGETPLLWTVTNDRLTMHPISPRIAIESAVSRLREAINKENSDINSTAADAYQTLFGNLPKEVAAKRHWLLALDVGLFDLPFAALRIGSSYLIEKHSLTLSPHSTLRSKRAENEEFKTFLGFGDPVYNRADARWSGQRQIFGNLLANREVFELARLPGTGVEIDRCARLVETNPVLIKGSDATAERLQSELMRNPAVIHFATHVIQSKADPRQAMIALSLKPDGVSSLLTRDTIAALRTNASVVTMSGCNSGLGRALPGAGLMGLTRAWLEAGAHSVVASLWPVPDDDGELLYSFYRVLRLQIHSASYALQTAQLESLQSGSWRSSPRYWAAYFIAGKD